MPYSPGGCSEECGWGGKNTDTLTGVPGFAQVEAVRRRLEGQTTGGLTRAAAILLALTLEGATPTAMAACPPGQIPLLALPHDITSGARGFCQVQASNQLVEKHAHVQLQCRG